MHYTLELLMRGDQKVVTYYTNALAHWKEILKSPDAESVDTLARRLTSEQMWFEHNCGGRWEGQEIMAFVGIAHLYTTEIGFEGSEELVLRIFDALMASYCSVEVKWHAERAAESYHLQDLRDEELRDE